MSEENKRVPRPEFLDQARFFCERQATIVPPEEVHKLALRYEDEQKSRISAALESDRVALRDQFAMAAMTGAIANCGWGRNAFSTIAHDSYGQADAMLKARDK